MKRFFYILFISTTVFFSFGFRSCEEAYCNFFAEIIVATYGVDRLYVVTNGSAIFSIKTDTCISELEHTSISSFKHIKSYSFGLQDNAGLYYFCAVGDSGQVVLSPDGGETWEDRSITGLTKNLYELDFFYQGTGFEPGLVVCGQAGSMNFSTNSGVSWEAVITPTTENLNSVTALAKTLFIVVGDSGTVIRTSDGGQTWANHTVGGAKFNSISDAITVAGYGYLWIAGDNGRIYATTNYGLNWFPQNSGVTENLNDIQFRNQNEGMVVGNNGVVRYTTNAGLTWLQDPYFNGFTNDDIISLAVRDENTASVLVRGTTSDGMATTTMITVSSEPLAVDDNGNILPSEYSLGQNYPNPFNPSTTIQFSIPEQSFVTLEIFNALGEKITTLVSKELNAGNHKYDWNVENMPSGIYFYELTAGSFVETKKMILMK